MIEDIARQYRLLALAALENRDFCGAPTQPRANSRRIVQRQTLSQQASAHTGKNIAHSAGSHSRITGRVIAQWATTFGHDGAAALEQKCHWKTVAELRRCFGARLFMVREKAFHFTRVGREESFSLATSEHRDFFREYIERVGIHHHRLLCFLN